MTEADRRPIAARNTGWANRLAGRLVGRGASPDTISLLGMAAAVGAGAALAAVPAAGPGWARLLWVLAALGVQLRLLANLLDGMVAIGRGVASPLGEVFNEVPDRVSDTAVLCGLGVAAGWPALGLGAALLAMATAYVRAVGKGLGRPSDFVGPGAKQQRMAAVTAVALLCAALPARWAAPLPEWALWLVVALATATVLRRMAHLVRGLRA